MKTQKVKNVILQTGSKYLVQGKLIQQADGETFISGFYSNSAEREDVNGFFICKIDTDAGNAVISSFKEVDGSKLGKGFIDESDIKKENKSTLKVLKRDVEENEFPGHFVIKSVTVNPIDSSFVILSELSQYNFNISPGGNSNEIIIDHRFIIKDILIVKSDRHGNISNITDLPKFQVEHISSWSGSVNGTA